MTRKHLLVGAIAVAIASLAMMCLRDLGAGAEGRVDRGTTHVAALPPPLPMPSAPANPATVIGGRVLGLDDSPIVGARVCAACADCALLLPQNAPRCHASSEDGSYSFHGLDPGPYRISAAAAGLLPSEAGDGQQIRVAYDGRVIDDADIYLGGQGARVAGRVKDVTGGFVIGATVRANFGDQPWHHLSQSTISDEEGRFELWVPPGPVALLANADGYSQGSETRVAPAEAVEISLTPGAAISGRVVTAQGRGVPRVTVEASTMHQPFGGTADVSDRDGSFRIDGLLPGSYYLRASGPGFVGAGQEVIELTVAEHRKDVIVPVVPGVRVEGRVNVAGEGPCQAGTVSIGAATPEAHVPGLRSMIDPEGLVVFEAVPTGAYAALVECQGALRGAPSSLEVGNENLLGLTWTVERGRALSVRARDEAGEPMPHLQLWLTNPALPEAQRVFVATTGEDGDAVFSGLPAGQYTLTHQAGPEAHVVSLPGDERVELVLHGVGRLSFTMKPTDGAALDAMHLVARSKDGEVFPLRSMGGDHYESPPLPEDEYDVYAVDGRNPPRKLTLDGMLALAGGAHQSKELTVEDLTGVLGGTVVDVQGAPLPNASIRVEPSEQVRDMAWNAEAMMLAVQGKLALSDPQGQFVVDHLVEGVPYTLIATAPTGVAAAQSQLVPGSSAVLTVPTAGSLSGVALMPDGSPCTDFFIRVNNDGVKTHNGGHFTDASGSWTLDRLSPGAHVITAQAPGPHAASVTVAMEASEQRTGVVMQLVNLGPGVDPAEGEPVEATAGNADDGTAPADAVGGSGDGTPDAPGGDIAAPNAGMDTASPAPGPAQGATPGPGEEADPQQPMLGGPGS